jgi:hypothetical protein
VAPKINELKNSKKTQNFHRATLSCFLPHFFETTVQLSKDTNKYHTKKSTMDQEQLVQLPQDLMKGLLENLCPSPKSVAEGENADRNTIIRELAIDFLHRVLEKTLIIMNHFYSLEIQ